MSQHSTRILILYCVTAQFTSEYEYKNHCHSSFLATKMEETKNHHLIFMWKRVSTFRPLFLLFHGYGSDCGFVFFFCISMPNILKEIEIEIDSDKWPPFTPSTLTYSVLSFLFFLFFLFCFIFHFGTYILSQIFWMAMVMIIENMHFCVLKYLWYSNFEHHMPCHSFPNRIWNRNWNENWNWKLRVFFSIFPDQWRMATTIERFLIQYHNLIQLTHSSWVCHFSFANDHIAKSISIFNKTKCRILGAWLGGWKKERKFTHE